MFHPTFQSIAHDESTAVRCIELVERYAARSGRDLSSIGYYHTFALFKLAVVIQQIFYRYHVGQTQDERFANFDQRVQALARTAHSMIQAQG